MVTYCKLGFLTKYQLTSKLTGTKNSWLLLIWTPRIVQEKTFKILDARLYSGS